MQIKNSMGTYAHNRRNRSDLIGVFRCYGFQSYGRCKLTINSVGTYAHVRMNSTDAKILKKIKEIDIMDEMTAENSLYRLPY